jgi:hypothetical protein
MKFDRTRNDTLWLLYWWGQWFIRLATTTLHILCRPAYHAWCMKRYGVPSGRVAMLDRQMERTMDLYDREIAEVLGESPFQDHDSF